MIVPVNPSAAAKRRYDGSRRQQAAAATRVRILDAARELFTSDGYAATTVAAIAERASVATDTVYAAVGTKSALFRELIELALSGTDTPVPGAERDYVARMRDEPKIEGKLAIYASAVTQIQERLAPLFLALRDASAGDEQLSAVWREVSERRARNMRRLTADLATTGRLRPDLSHEEIADVIWSMNSPDYYSQLVTERGWTPARFERWLLDAWTRLLVT